jgi:hypothetical protein
MKYPVLLIAVASSALLLCMGCSTPRTDLATTPSGQDDQNTRERQTPKPPPSTADDILAAARLQQEHGNLEISRRILASAADNLASDNQDIANLLRGWHRLDLDLDRTLAKEHLPFILDDGRPHDVNTDIVSCKAHETEKCWDQTQGEALLREAFNKAYDSRRYPGILRGVGYKVAEHEWKESYVRGWLGDSRHQVTAMEECRPVMVKPLDTFDILKASERDLSAKLDAVMIGNLGSAQDIAGLSSDCRGFLNALAGRRTEWVSYALISPYLGNASFEAWASEYATSRWDKTEALKRACQALGRCDKEMLLQCNEGVRTQFAEAYGDIKKACGKDTELFDYLKVYQTFVEALQQRTAKKGAERWLEQ